MLEHQPHHIRRKIAFLCTLAAAVILIAVMVLHYTKAKPTGTKESSSRIKAFFTTVSEGSQSLFGSK